MLAVASCDLKLGFAVLASHLVNVRDRRAMSLCMVIGPFADGRAYLYGHRRKQSLGFRGSSMSVSVYCVVSLCHAAAIKCHEPRVAHVLAYCIWKCVHSRTLRHTVK